MCLYHASISPFFLLPVLLKLLKHVKLIVKCELLFVLIKKSGIPEKRHWWPKWGIHHWGVWRRAYHWGFKEDPINDKPKENLITEDPQLLQDPQWLLRRKKLFVVFWWWYMIECVMGIKFHVRILVWEGLFFILQVL